VPTVNDTVDETDGVFTDDVLDPRVVGVHVFASSDGIVTDDDKPPITWTATHSGPVTEGEDFVVTFQASRPTEVNAFYHSSIGAGWRP
jgi:hypothetical protein